MITSDLATVVLAIMSIASTVVAIVAAVAALRSATAAESSAKSAEAIPRRALIRDLAATAEQVVDWVQATEAKVQQWKAQHNSYCAMMGTYQSGGRVAVQQKIDAKLTEITALRPEADAISRESPQLHTASDDDLSVKLGKLTATLDKLHRIYDEATSALASLEAMAAAEWDRRHAANSGTTRGPRRSETEGNSQAADR